MSRMWWIGSSSSRRMADWSTKRSPFRLGALTTSDQLDPCGSRVELPEIVRLGTRIKTRVGSAPFETSVKTTVAIQPQII